MKTQIDGMRSSLQFSDHVYLLRSPDHDIWHSDFWSLSLWREINTLSKSDGCIAAYSYTLVHLANK